jgi:hypothetical protein
MKIAIHIFLGLTLVLVADSAATTRLKVMKIGLGSGRITSNTGSATLDLTLGIDCGGDCDHIYLNAEEVTLRASPDAGSVFVRWEGDGAGTDRDRTTVIMDTDRSVRAVFDLASPSPGTPAIPPLALADLSPAGISNYLYFNSIVNTPARFLNALPREFKENWIFMTRSESLQTGTAEYPRLLLPSVNSRSFFTIGLARHGSYPAAHPNAIEYMQWDDIQKNFRFHEIVVADIPAMDTVTRRLRGVSADDSKCSKCHSTQNVLNRSSFPGTTGIPPGMAKAMNKPNWDTYDSWGGMLAFNRDRIYQGSVEAAAFRRILNPWTWRTNDSIRAIIEQLHLQPREPRDLEGSPTSMPERGVITRTNGGANDGHVNFYFDNSPPSPPVLTEPVPTSSGVGREEPISTFYSFNGRRSSAMETSATPVTRGGSYATLFPSSFDPGSDEGRAVRLFGYLTTLNAQRVGNELTNHSFATGGFPIDIRPIALAITIGLLTNVGNTIVITSTASPLMFNRPFFDQRNGLTIDQVVEDTISRAKSLPRRKADIQARNLRRTDDVYLSSAARHREAFGLIQQFGSATSAETDTSMRRLRQEVFRRPLDFGPPDDTVMGGIYVDREIYGSGIQRLALFRYFLEPLGVSVDKWSMGVRGRSRTYTFADLFGNYLGHFEQALQESLRERGVDGFSFDRAPGPEFDQELIRAVTSTLSSLPRADAVPAFTDIQRIFNKSCIECHGGLRYPPYQNYSGILDLSEDENPPLPPLPSARLVRSYENAAFWAAAIDRRITQATEVCPEGLMPCGGPALSEVDKRTLRRWIRGGPSSDRWRSPHQDG